MFLLYSKETFLELDPYKKFLKSKLVSKLAMKFLLVNLQWRFPVTFSRSSAYWKLNLLFYMKQSFTWLKDPYEKVLFWRSLFNFTSAKELHHKLRGLLVFFELQEYLFKEMVPLKNFAENLTFDGLSKTLVSISASSLNKKLFCPFLSEFYMTAFNFNFDRTEPKVPLN